MILFFCLKFLLLMCGVFVVTVRSPVHSVLLLISTFSCAAALLLLIGVDFLAFVFILVYIGAIAVLFLFVVMMLNLKSQRSKNIGPFKEFLTNPRLLLKILVIYFFLLKLLLVLQVRMLHVFFINFLLFLPMLKV